MNVGSLFSGIGGLDLGLERAGMNVIWQFEIDPYASRVLAKHWPTVPNLGDITTIDWTTVERPDVICGGFPCQPVSIAGKGRAQSDPRWLWPEYQRAIRALRPSHVIVENVPGLLQRGLGVILGDLAALRYDSEWDRVPAWFVGAPHRRERVWIVAHSASKGSQGCGCERQLGEGGGAFQPGRTGERRGEESWSSHWRSEPGVDRVAHGIPHRVDKLRALGNAVVPQCAEWIGRKVLADVRRA